MIFPLYLSNVFTQMANPKVAEVSVSQSCMGAKSASYVDLEE